MAELPYRSNVCMILFNKEKKILVGERRRQSNIWQFPQGGVEDNFSLEENVIRELEEELSLSRDDIRIHKKLQATHSYDWQVIPEHFKGQYKGQAQTFWLVEVLNEAAVNPNVADHPEFQKVQWVPVDHVLAVVEPIRIQGYSAPLKEVKEYLASL